MGELVQSSGKGGLPRDLLCGTSGRRELCMVPYDSCHIYGIWTSRSKKVWRRFKAINWGGNASRRRGTLFIRKRNSHYVILLYCETSL